MDEKEFEQTIKLTELFYKIDSSYSGPEQREELDSLINDVADFYIEERKKVSNREKNEDTDTWQRYNALLNLFSKAIKVCPSLASKQDENGNTFMHKMANAGFWSVCLSAVEHAPSSMDIKNNDGQSFVDIYGIAELKDACGSVLRLSGGASEELKGVYKTLDEKYPEVKDPYVEALNEYIRKQKNEEQNAE